MITKKSTKAWIKEHKKELILAGVGTAISLGLVYIGLKEKDQILEIFNKFEDTDVKDIETFKANIPIPVQSETLELTDSSSNMSLSEVMKHVRNLPEGQHPSIEKINSASENGFELLENQTWVTDYTKGRSAA